MPCRHRLQLEGWSQTWPILTRQQLLKPYYLVFPTQLRNMLLVKNQSDTISAFLFESLWCSSIWKPISTKSPKSLNQVNPSFWNHHFQHLPAKQLQTFAPCRSSMIPYILLFAEKLPIVLRKFVGWRWGAPQKNNGKNNGNTQNTKSKTQCLQVPSQSKITN